MFHAHRAYRRQLRRPRRRHPIGASAPTAATANGAANVHCYGVNTCKGMSDCRTAGNDCKGRQRPQGQGFEELSSKTCEATGGSLSAG